MEILDLREKLEERRPVVHCITNIVTVNDCANILLALGASPTMAHHPEETAEVTEACDALVCNLGATESFDAMLPAMNTAAKLGHPIVIDPVGVGASSFRRNFLKKLLEEARTSRREDGVLCIRGNYSEILALWKDCNTTAGVDADPEMSVKSEKIKEQVCEATIALAKRYNAVIIASGKEDILSDGKETVTCLRGGEMMSRVTGMGCMLSSLLGAFFAVGKELELSPLQVALSCVDRYNRAGEMASVKGKSLQEGPYAFKESFISFLTYKKQ